MSLDQHHPDRLGDLCGRYSGRVYGLLWITVAAGVVALGRLITANAVGIAAQLSAGLIDPRLFAGVGWTLVGGGGFLGVRGLIRMVQSFEIRRGGVRYRSWLGRREMSWRDVDEILVKKRTYVLKTGGRKTRYRIRIASQDGRISLGSGFLRAVSALELIQLLKLHSGVAVTGDCDDIRVPASLRESFQASVGGDFDARPARRKKRIREPRAEKPAAKTPFDDVCDRLAAGASAPEVEAWLQGQGMPVTAARAMVDKAVTRQLHRETLHREAEPPDSTERKLIRQAREQLSGGATSEKVERWLRAQGVPDQLAAAMVQNAREGLL